MIRTINIENLNSAPTPWQYLCILYTYSVLAGGGGGGMVQFFGGNLTHFFDIQFKNTFNLIILRFKVPPERFFTRISKQVLLFEISGFNNFNIESEVVNI